MMALVLRGFYFKPKPTTENLMTLKTLISKGAAATLAAALLIPCAARADLLYTHYFLNSDVELFSFSHSPASSTDELRITFTLGQGGEVSGSTSAILQPGLNQIDFVGDLLQNMRVKSADGIIDPSDLAAIWNLEMRFTGGGIGDARPEAFDIQNPDTPQQTQYDPAYLAALTGANIQGIRLTVQDACFDGQDFPTVCNDLTQLDAGFQGRIFLEFFGEPRVAVSEPASLPLFGMLMAGLAWASRRRK
jgi:hypothetical protein